MHQRKLRYQDAYSNKEYWVTIAQAASDGQWLVVGSWGRRGSVNQCKLYLRTPTRAAAINQGNALMDSKVGRGYKDANGGYPSAFGSREFEGGAAPEAEKPVQDAGPVVVIDIAEALFG